MAMIGIDLVEVRNIERIVKANGPIFVEKVFTANEVDYCMNKKRCFEHLAARFAIKEAVFKAFGTGKLPDVRWREIETVNDNLGKPLLELHGNAKKLAEKKGVKNIEVSISHAQGFAIGAVIMEV